MKKVRPSPIPDTYDIYLSGPIYGMVVKTGEMPNLREMLTPDIVEKGRHAGERYDMDIDPVKTLGRFVDFFSKPSNLELLIKEDREQKDAANDILSLHISHEVTLGTWLTIKEPDDVKFGLLEFWINFNQERGTVKSFVSNYSDPLLSPMRATLKDPEAIRMLDERLADVQKMRDGIWKAQNADLLEGILGKGRMSIQMAMRRDGSETRSGSAVPNQRMVEAEQH